MLLSRLNNWFSDFSKKILYLYGAGSSWFSQFSYKSPPWLAVLLIVLRILGAVLCAVLCAVLRTVLRAVIVLVLLLLVLAVLTILVIIVFRHFTYILLVLCYRNSIRIFTKLIRFQYRTLVLFFCTLLPKTSKVLWYYFVLHFF